MLSVEVAQSRCPLEVHVPGRKALDGQNPVELRAGERGARVEKLELRRQPLVVSAPRQLEGPPGSGEPSVRRRKKEAARIRKIIKAQQKAARAR